MQHLEQRIALAAAVGTKVTSVTAPQAGSYRAGDELVFSVAFSSPVAVVGTPQLDLTIGRTVRPATYFQGSGTTALSFRYTVQPGEADTDGIAMAKAIGLPAGAAIRDVSTQAAVATAIKPPNTKKVLVDSAAPAVASVAGPAKPSAAGGVLSFTVNFTEPVFVTGVPTLPIGIGSAVRDAVWNGKGNGTKSLVFTTTVRAGDAAPSGVRIAGPIGLPGGAVIRDAAGNGANPAAAGQFPRATVDAVGPAATSFGAVAIDGRTKAVTLQVTFSEAVTVKGKPFIPFTLDGVPKQLVYASGSGKNVLTFAYKPAKGESPTATNVVVPARAISLPAGASLGDALKNQAASLAAPSGIALSPASIAENNAIGAVIGTLSTTDADAVRDRFTYTLVGGVGAADNASFTIDGSQLKAADAFDFESRSSYSIRVRGTDAGGLFVEQAFTVAVTDVAEVPLEPATLSALALASDTGISSTDRLTNSAALQGTANNAVKLLAAVNPVGESPAYADVSPALGAGGAFTITAAQIDALAGGRLADGAHTVRVVAENVAGVRSAAATIAFTLDRTKPGAPALRIAATDAADTAGTETAAARVLLTGSTEPSARVTVNGIASLAGPGGAFQVPDVALVPGANAFGVLVADAAGNAADAPASFSFTRSARSQGDAVLGWNAVALRAIQRDVTDPPVATRTLAMLGIAQYDTLAAISGTPAFLVQQASSGDVNPQAAAAFAAHRLLVTIYPAQKAALDAELAAAIQGIPADAALDTARALGVAVADKVYAARSQDGAAGFIDYSDSMIVGKWQKTGPMFDVPDQPHWKGVAPFAIASADAYRPAAPPALGSADYAAAFNDTKSLGSATSTTRTADQTQQALFWADGKGSYTPPGHWIEIAAGVARAQGNSLSANARLFAQLNVALADAAIACWDAKYTYEAWRPETAIRQGAADGNDATAADGAWRPLLITPPHPEYVSGHSTFSAAAAKVLANAFGDAVTFDTTSPTLLNVTKTYASFSAAAADAGRSRIYGGIHFEFSNQAGQAIGRSVADAVLTKFAVGGDTSAPAVVAAPVPAAVSAVPTITGQLLDNIGVVAASFTLDGGARRPLAFAADGSFTIPAAALGTLADGPHVVTIYASDAVGNENAGRSIGFTLDSAAPVVSLTSLADGDALTASSRLIGTANGTGSGLVLLSYAIDGGITRTLTFDRSTGAFDAPLAVGNLGIGPHSVAITARDAAGNTATLTRTVKIESLAPFTVTNVLPDAGTNDVGVTQRPQVFFSRAVNRATLTADSFYATDATGTKLPMTVVPADDGSYAFLIPARPMPGGTQVTVTVDGSKIRAAADGAFLDADGDGMAGGAGNVTFTTVSTAVVTGTKLVGRVVDPGADLEPMTFDDIRRGPDGIIHTGDDVFLNPIVHAKVWIIGREDNFVFTDAQGNFTLENVPAGAVKVVIDGRTATNAPDGIFWPEMVMAVDLTPGLTNTVMTGQGTTEERLANATSGPDGGGRVEVYLPRVQSSILQTVAATGTTRISVDEAVAAPALTQEQRQNLVLTIDAGVARDDAGNVIESPQIGISTVPPELVRDMLPAGVLQHSFDITIQAPGVSVFTTPLRITFPNVFNAEPGTKLSIMSFDHTSGKLVINGTGTVSADGKTVVSDADAGIRAPGWHSLTPPGSCTSGRLGGNQVTGSQGAAAAALRKAEGRSLLAAVDLTRNVVSACLSFVPVVGPILNIANDMVSISKGCFLKAEAAGCLSAVSSLTVNVFSLGLPTLSLLKPIAQGIGLLASEKDIGDSIEEFGEAARNVTNAYERSLEADVFDRVSVPDCANAAGVGNAGGSVASGNRPLGNPAIDRTRQSLLSAKAATINLVNQVEDAVTTTREINDLISLIKTAPDGRALDPGKAEDLAEIQANLDRGDNSPTSILPEIPVVGGSAGSRVGDAFALTLGLNQQQRVVSTLSASRLQQLFCFQATAGDLVTLSVDRRGVDNSKVLLVRLFDGDGNEIARDFTSGLRKTPYLANIVLPRDGRYYVGVSGGANSAYDPITGRGGLAHGYDGDYELSITRRSAATSLGIRYAAAGDRYVAAAQAIAAGMLVDGGAQPARYAVEASRLLNDVLVPSRTAPTIVPSWLAIRNNATGLVLRTMSSASGTYSAFLAGDTSYTVYGYDPTLNRSGRVDFRTSRSGSGTAPPRLFFDSLEDRDSDADGLSDTAEFVIGTNPRRSDSAGNGLSDYASIQLGQNPLGGRLLPNGVIASLPLAGNAVAIDVVASSTDVGARTAFVALGTSGLAIIDVSRPTTPTLLSTLDLQANARDVAVDVGRGIAAVGTVDAGLVLVDVTNRTVPAIVTRVKLPDGVTHVRLRDGLAYVAHGGKITVIDEVTGDIRQTVDTGNREITALGIDAAGLYVAGSSAPGSNAIGVYAPGVDGNFSLRGVLEQSQRVVSIFAADGRLTLGVEDGFANGLMTVDVSNLGTPQLISDVDLNSIAGRSVVLNGTGLAITVGSPGRRNTLDVVDLSDPTATDRLQTSYALAATPRAVKLAGGMAYVADGEGGLMVVNYAGLDNLGLAPTVSIGVVDADIDPFKDGIQVTEGHPVWIRPTVSDDVQIKSLELLVNGIVVETATSYPYELVARAPARRTDGATMSIQVRATDTGNNASLSNVIPIAVVGDTFAPVLTAISLADGDSRYGLRSVDVRFDELLDTARLDAAHVFLVRAGADGLFDTADDIRRSVMLDVRSRGQVVSVVVPGTLSVGNYRLTIDRSIIADPAGNQLAADIIRTFTIRSAGDVNLDSGFAAEPTLPATNPGREISFGVPFDPATARLDMTVSGFMPGNPTIRTLSPARFDADRGVAHFIVPLDAITGDVRLYSAAPAQAEDIFRLQIVPIVTDAHVEAISADDQTMRVVLSGFGFQDDGDAQYRVGSTTVVDTGSNVQVFESYGSDRSSQPNTRVRLTLPLTADVFGAITASSSGGRSAAFTRSLSSIASTAVSGTPADPAQASANAGQAVTLVGAGLSTATDVLLRYVDVEGVVRARTVTPTVAVADGTRATLILPGDVNGAFGVWVLGSTSQPVLQVVPVVSGWSVENRTALFGSGFVEGASTYALPGATVTDANTADESSDVGIDVSSDGKVSFGSTTLPWHGVGMTTVTTAGGTSAPIAVGVVRVRVPGTVLGDVAVSPDGNLWVGDTADPGALHLVSPATGVEIRSLPLPGGSSSTSLGLQVVPVAMSLGGTAVPAGSLLVFNGYADWGSGDTVTAIDPADGTVLASLVLDGNYDLSAGVYDPASGHLFITANGVANGQQLVELDPATGAKLATIDVGIDVRSHSGLAIDPTTGHLWLGSVNGGPQVIEYRIDGVGQLTELGRFSTVFQGLDGNKITGLAFTADGTLWAGSTSGCVFRLDLSRDDAAVPTATLTSVAAVAAEGTPMDAAKASANVGSVIELVGTNFGRWTRVLFQTRDNAGKLGVVSTTPLSIHAGGTRLTVQVPDLATTGAVRVVNQGVQSLDGSFFGSGDAVYRGVSVSFTASGPTATVQFAGRGLEDVSDESWGLDNVRVTGPGAANVFSDDFAGAAKPGWGDAATSSEKLVAVSRFSGRFGSINGINRTQSLALSGLMAGQTYTVTFDLYAFGTWDGLDPQNPGGLPDTFSVSVDGQPLLDGALSNMTGAQYVQTFRASAGIPLQIVPTLRSIEGLPGSESQFTLRGSGFMEGATTLTVGGVSIADQATNDQPFDVQGTRNDTFTAVAPLAVISPIRVTTAGGWAEIAAPALGNRPVTGFTAIRATADLGTPTDVNAPSANTAQAITLVGQGFTNRTEVEFTAVDDTGRLGTVVRTGSASLDGRTLTVVVPALARTGSVRVLGSGVALPLQVVPTLRALGGTVATGTTIVLEGTGLTVNDLFVSIDGRAIDTFSVRTTVDGDAPTDGPIPPDQQFLTLVVPAGVAAGQIRVVTAGGECTLGDTSITALTAVASSGTPALAGLPSATVGQSIVLSVADPGFGDRVVFTSIDANGNVSERTVTPTAIDFDLATITVVVPANATTGCVRLSREENGVILQVVPAVDGAGLSVDFWTRKPDLYVSGSGFAEGLVSVSLGGTRIADVSRLLGVDVLYGSNGNGLMRFILPTDPPTGPISVTTVGGTSAPLAISFTGITGTASSGTPADAAIASANPGDTITIVGTGLSADTWVIFRAVDNGGAVSVKPTAVAPDGTSATVVVPLSARTGTVRVLGSAAQHQLQIVPVVTAARIEYIDADSRTVTVVLSGAGFIENDPGSRYGFGTMDHGDAGPDVVVSGGSYGPNNAAAPNARVRLTLPLTADVLGAITARTAGGTSDAVLLNLDVPYPPAPAIGWAWGTSLSQSQIDSGIDLTGTGFPGATVTLTFDSGHVPAAGSSVIVAADGTWSLPLSPADLGVNGFGVGGELVSATQTLPRSGSTSGPSSTWFTIPGGE